MGNHDVDAWRYIEEVASLCSNLGLFLLVSELVPELLFFRAHVHAKLDHGLPLDLRVGGERLELLPNGLAELRPFAFQLVESVVVLPLFVAGEAGEIGLEAVAAALALVGVVRGVVFVGVGAGAGGPPLVHIKSLPPRKPPEANFFRPSGDESEVLAWTVVTVRLSRLLPQHLFVVLEQVSTEASRFSAHPHAVVLLPAAPRHVDPTVYGLSRMAEFPHQHLFRSRGRAEVLHTL